MRRVEKEAGGKRKRLERGREVTEGGDSRREEREIKGDGGGRGGGRGQKIALRKGGGRLREGKECGRKIRRPGEREIGAGA